MPPIGGSSLGGLPAIGKGRSGAFDMDDDYIRQVSKEMDSFADFNKKDNWADPHASASMHDLMRERKQAAEAKR